MLWALLCLGGLGSLLEPREGFAWARPDWDGSGSDSST